MVRNDTEGRLHLSQDSGRALGFAGAGRGAAAGDRAAAAAARAGGREPAGAHGVPLPRHLQHPAPAAQ